MESILNTDLNWMVSPWINMAKEQSEDVKESEWWEFNARNQITLWGPNGEIADYGTLVYPVFFGTCVLHMP